MPKYLFAYHGGSQPSTPEDGQKVMKLWMDWMDGLGAALVEPGNPTGPAKTIGSGGKMTDGGGPNAVTGYSVVDAATLDDAVKLAQGCPQLMAGGTVEVAEIRPVM